MIAAALAGKASVVATNDQRLRAETETADIDVVAMTVDDFAVHVWELMPDEVDEVVKALVAKRTKRPISAEELVETLRGPFPAMAAAWLATARGCGSLRRAHGSARRSPTTARPSAPGQRPR